MNRLYKITIHGRVQGVFYRASTKKTADDLGLTGFVRNEDNGNVYIEVVGPGYAVDQFMEWCWEGPPMARIDKLDVEEGPLQNFEGFEIVR